MHVDNSEVKTSDKKIHDFSRTKPGKRKKAVMSEPVTTIIIRAQQNFGWWLKSNTNRNRRRQNNKYIKNI